jgi:hypothetical protein
MTQEQLRMQMLAGIITEGEYKAKLNENMGPTPEKRKMLLDKIKTRVPGQEREFLEFMGMSANSFEDYSKYSMDDLLDAFIGFEEDHNEEELTGEITDEALDIYVPGFERGDGVF